LKRKVQKGTAAEQALKKKVDLSQPKDLVIEHKKGRENRKKGRRIGGGRSFFLRIEQDLREKTLTSW